MGNGGNVWQTLIENSATVIGAAAQSALGIVALVILALAIVAVIFFNKGGVKTRLGVFILLLLVFTAFGGAAMYREAANIVEERILINMIGLCLINDKNTEIIYMYEWSGETVKKNTLLPGSHWCHWRPEKDLQTFSLTIKETKKLETKISLCESISVCNESYKFPEYLL